MCVSQGPELQEQKVTLFISEEEVSKSKQVKSFQDTAEPGAAVSPPRAMFQLRTELGWGGWAMHGYWAQP